jgi:hypothetical protein
MSEETLTESSTEAPAPAEQAPAQEEAAAADTSRQFSQEDIERARSQEKDKLYPKIERLQTQMEHFSAEAEAAKSLVHEEQLRVEEERKRREEEEMSARDLIERRDEEWSVKFNSAQEEWQTKIEELEARDAAKTALLEKEREYQEVQSYRERRLQEEQEGIMPELMSFVSGNNKEEIDASISAVMDRTSAIMESLQEALPAQPARPKGVPSTGGTPSGPMYNTMEQKTFSDTDIANMDMQTYAEHRERLKRAATNQWYGH